MLLSSEYNKLAWSILRQYSIPLKWAMKTAYCLRELPIDNPRLWLTKPGSPLASIWDPANVMKLVSVLRSQARLANSGTRREDLDNAATDIYDKYCQLEGVGCEFMASLLDGELIYWATKYYVDSIISKKNNLSEGTNILAIELSEGTSYPTPWFDYPHS